LESLFAFFRSNKALRQPVFNPWRAMIDLHELE